jgi:FOG: Ankyrin repeat
MLASDTCRGQIAKLLLDNGANVNAADLSGNTSLIKASLCRHENIVRLLLQRGADVNVVNNDGKAALDIAQERGYHNIVRLLHQHGAQRLPADWTELCDDLSEAGIEELRDILRNDVTAENYTTVAEAFELTSTEPTEENILRFKNSLKRYTKPQLCARLAQYYYQCRDKIDAISLENWFEDYRSYGSVFVTADRNCYNVENLYQSTLRNHIDPLTRRELTPRELETLNIRRERIRRSRR